jgi:TnpA family transposase
LADALNLGPDKMAAASPHTSFKRLVWMYTWFIDDDAYRQALAALVNFELSLPWAQVQGPATTSSSDAQFFPTGRVRSDTARVNRHYGSEPGLFFYVHTATQLRQAFHVQVISTWLHQAPYALSGLLYHESDLQIERHFTDTLGYTDEIAALFHMLGYRYVSRLRHFNDYRLYTPGKTTQFPLLEPFIGGRINDPLMGRKWDDLLRLRTSLKLGVVTPPLALQRLSGHVRQNDLALALREMGRIDQTLTRLNWLQDPLLCSDSQTSLLRGESQNSLQRAVCFHRLGRIRDRDFESQSHRASGLTPRYRRHCRLEQCAAMAHHSGFARRGCQYHRRTYSTHLADTVGSHRSDGGLSLGYAPQSEPHESPLTVREKSLAYIFYLFLRNNRAAF